MSSNDPKPDENAYKKNSRRKPITIAASVAAGIAVIFSILYLFDPTGMESNDTPITGQADKETIPQSSQESSSFYPYLVESYSATQQGDELSLGILTELGKNQNDNDGTMEAIPSEFDKKRLGVSDDSIGFAYAWFSSDSVKLGHSTSSDLKESGTTGHYKGYVAVMFDSKKLEEMRENSKLDVFERYMTSTTGNNTSSWNVFFARTLMIPDGREHYGFDFCLNLSDPPRRQFHSDYDLEEGDSKRVLSAHTENGSVIAKNPPFLDPYVTQDSFKIAMSFEVLPEYENCHGELGGLILDETKSKIGWDLFEFYTKGQN